jgi:hypothetical protein
MKNLFRLSFALVPALFLMSTTAYSSDYSLIERDITQVGANRAPAASSSSSKETSGDIKLNALSPQVDRESAQSTAGLTQIKELTPTAAPVLGSAIGVQVAVFSFK